MIRNKKGTIGIVVVSHSNRLAQEVINFVKVLQQEDFNIENGGKVSEDEFGTTVETVKEAIRRADRGAGVLVFVDMGSSIFHSLKAVEDLKGEIEAEIADSPLVEGVISAVAANFDGMKLNELRQIAEESREFIKIRK